MADNSLQNGTDTIATDDVTTLNGGASSGIKVQRVKVGFGSDNTFRDVDAANGLPVAMPANVIANGTLSASDAVVGAPVGDGTLVTGASTAGSIVFATAADGMIAWTLLIKGYVSGTIYTEASNNTTNGTDGDWVEVKGRRTGTAPGTESVVYAMVANGYYRGNLAGFKSIRARLIGGTGPTINWIVSNGVGATFLNSGLPGGSSVIGKVGIDQTTPGTTNAVFVTNTSLAVTGAFFQATQPISAATLPLPTGASTETTLAALNTKVTAVNTGAVVISGALPVGANSIGTVVLTAETTKVIGTVNLATPTAFSLSSAATTNATSIKATAGTVFQVVASNVGAAAAFLKLFNLAAAPTVGTSVPFLTVPITASGVVSISFGALGMRFGTGIALSITNLVADTDTTVIAAAQVKVAISYI